MGLTPNIQRKKASFVLKRCERCKGSFGPESFAVTQSVFYPDGAIPVCNECIDGLINLYGADWTFIDKLCQMSNIPFIPKEWQNIYEMNPDGAFYRYSQVFLSSEYDGLNWTDYFEMYKELRDRGGLEEELPGLADEKRERLKKLWGANYDDEALDYLDRLYNGLLTTQNINGKLQMDQAQKICKMSYEIDRRIEEGSDFDKLLASYDKLVRAAEFTPKNVKNINDFDTFGEAAKWMEKNGWRNRFYDNVTRDIVDETIKNFQSFVQRLYVNESSIGDEINRRIEQLKSASAIENDSYYGTDAEHDLDSFEQKGYEDLFGDGGDFLVDPDDEEGEE